MIIVHKTQREHLGRHGKPVCSRMLKLTKNILFLFVYYQSLIFKCRNFPHERMEIAGQQLVLSCRSNTAVQWIQSQFYNFQNGLVLFSQDTVRGNNAPANAFASAHGDTKTLVFNPLTYEQNGKYFRCSRGSPSDVTDFSVFVFAHASSTKISGYEGAAIEGAQLNITCCCTGANPQPNFAFEVESLNIQKRVPGGYNPFAEYCRTFQITVDRSYHNQDCKCIFTYTSEKLKRYEKVEEKTAKLTVLFDVRTRTAFTEYVGIIGEKLSVDCQVSANPPIESVTWRDSNDILPPGASEKQTFPDDGSAAAFLNYTLHFSSVDFNHQGRYTCHAERSMGLNTNDDSDFAHIDVLVYYQDSPKVTCPPIVRVNESSDLIVRCNVTSPTTTSSHWVQKRVGSKYMTGDVLRYPEISRLDAGVWTVTVINTLHKTRGPLSSRKTVTEFTVIVQHKPDEAKIEAQQPLFVGDTALLKCTANAVPLDSLKYEWRKFSQSMQRWMLVAEIAGPYEIRDLQVTDDSTYECVPVNFLGSGPAAQIKVAVNLRSFFNDKPPSQKYFRISDTAFTMSCVVTSKPDPVIRWFKDSTELSSGILYKITYQQTRENYVSTVNCTIEFAKFPDHHFGKAYYTGTYKCSATTDVLQHQPLVTEVYVAMQYTPSVIFDRELLFSKVGADAVLDCLITGFPKPDVQWKKDEMVIMSREKFLITTTVSNVTSSGHEFLSRLTVKNFREADGGRYHCIASNEEGVDQSAIVLSRIGPPEPPVDLTVLEVDWDTIWLTWKAGFNYEKKQVFTVSYKWDKGEDQRKTQKVVLALRGLYPNTAYSLAVYGSNSLGDGEKRTTAATTGDLELLDPVEPLHYSRDRMIRYQIENDQSNDYCMKVEETLDKGKTWSPFYQCVNVTKNLIQQEIFVNSTNSTFRISTCLQKRPEICMKPTVVQKFMTGAETSKLFNVYVPSKTVGTIRGNAILHCSYHIPFSMDLKGFTWEKQAKGSPPYPVFQYPVIGLKNGMFSREFSGRASTEFFHEQTSLDLSITLSDLQLSDEAVYRCLVKAASRYSDMANKHSTISQVEETTLKVYIPPSVPVIKGQSSRTVFTLGHPYSLTCVVNLGKPEALVRWLIWRDELAKFTIFPTPDGLRYGNEKKKDGTRLAYLDLILTLNESHNNTGFLCEATNRAETTGTQSKRLTVHEKMPQSGQGPREKPTSVVIDMRFAIAGGIAGGVSIIIILVTLVIIYIRKKALEDALRLDFCSKSTLDFQQSSLIFDNFLASSASLFGKVGSRKFSEPTQPHELPKRDDTSNKDTLDGTQSLKSLNLVRRSLEAGNSMTFRRPV